MRIFLGILIWLILISAAYSQGLYTEYAVTSSMQNKIFHIAGRRFKAMQTCDVDEGDIVVFQGSSPFNCFQTTFYNRNKGIMCDVYCDKRP